MTCIIVTNSPKGKLYYCGDSSCPYHDWTLTKSDAYVFENKRKADKLLKYYRKRDMWVSDTLKVEEI